MKERNERAPKPKKEFEETLLEVRRVTRVTTGGRRMSFRATILVGNKKGKIGLGVAKGPDVAIAVQKASHEAYKNLFIVPLTANNSIPYAVFHKYKSAQVKLIPAASGTGMKAGSAVRSTLELAGYTNILSKIVGTNNKLNNAIATIQALATFKVDREALKKLHQATQALETSSSNDETDQEATETSSKKPSSRRPASKAASPETTMKKAPVKRAPAKK